MKKYLILLDKWLFLRIEETILGFGLLALSIIVFINVILRYFFDFSPAWSDELPRYMMIWLTFIGMSYCVRKGEHVNIDIVFSKLPPVLKKAVYLAMLMINFVFSVYLVYKGWGLCQKLIALNQLSVSLQIPIGYIFSVLPIGCALMAKNYAHLFFKNIFTPGVSTQIEGD